MTKIAKAEIVVNLLCRSARYSQVQVLAVPNSRGMVRCAVWNGAGEEIEVSLPWQVLRWY